MLFINKLFNSIACLLSFTNLQLVIPGRTWILLYKARHAHKRLYMVLPKYSKIQVLPGITSFTKIIIKVGNHKNMKLAKNRPERE